MLTTLTLPSFARIADLLGLWCIEPLHFQNLLSIAARIQFAAHEPEPLKSALEKTPAGDGKSIAVVKIAGVMMKSQSSLGGTSTIQARRDIRQAAADSEVGGILLAVDSPGGTVSGTHDLAQEVTAARLQKPVWAAIEDTGASAAYWVASQADRVVANSPTALVGSIGTYQTVTDSSAAAEQSGVKTLLFSTGPLKGLGTPGTPVTDGQMAHVQMLVDTVQRSFDAAVMSGRKMSPTQLAEVRHGGVLTAQAAMDAGLIDAIQPIGTTLDQMKQQMASGKKKMPQPYMAEKTSHSLPMRRRDLPILKAV